MTATPPLSSRDTKTDLLEAAQAAVKEQEERAAAEAVAAAMVPRRRRIGVMSVIALAGLVVLIVQPAWLREPATLPTESVAVSSASLRLTLLRERDRVFAYNREHKQLPASLAEAGSSLSAVQYERIGDGAFLLSSHVGDSLIVLRSSDSLKAFLGGALKVIKNRGNQ